jgi:xylan 1,4-beta-xylosidase
MSDSGEYSNPILPGFYPDPSICRAGDDFFLVNSSFAYFPGLPIHHSRDLAHWKQIGHVLDRPSQLPLDGARITRGLFAPTIRYCRGVFYLVCTNIDNGGNFITTARDPAGPWSEPAWLPDAVGIDPSLFFDEGTDGGVRAWYCGTRAAPEGERYPGNWEVWLRELDLGTMSLKGEALGIWRGALRDCIWPEGPHIYKKDGWYYLMAAEGGTGIDHAVSIARSRTLEGPWIGKAANPILTHRHLGKGASIINVGHGDLVDDPNGGWWMVLLASRPYDGSSNLGRETFLVPVDWEDEWPLPCPGSGRVEERFAAPELPRFDAEPERERDDFDEGALAAYWISPRVPASSFSSLSERPGHLRLRLLPGTTRGKDAASCLVRRQRHMSWSARASMEFEPRRDGEAAGLILLQSEDFQYRLELSRAGRETVIRVVIADGGPDRALAQKAFTGGRIVLEATARGQSLAFRAGPSADELAEIFSGADGRILSTERAGGFVGTTVGMFATSGGLASSSAADFGWFEYTKISL